MTYLLNTSQIPPLHFPPSRMPCQQHLPLRRLLVLVPTPFSRAIFIKHNSDRVAHLPVAFRFKCKVPCGLLRPGPCLPLQPTLVPLPSLLSCPCPAGLVSASRWPRMCPQILHTCRSLRQEDVPPAVHLANSCASPGLSLNVTFPNCPSLTLNLK